MFFSNIKNKIKILFEIKIWKKILFEICLQKINKKKVVEIKIHFIIYIILSYILYNR